MARRPPPRRPEPNGDPAPGQLVVQKKALFLEALAGPARGNVVRAAKIAGVGADLPRRWARRDSSFAQLMEEAKEHGREGLVDLLEAEAERRALGGAEVDVFQGGKKVGVRKTPSDLLMIFLLKRHVPEYRDRLPGPAPGNIHITVNTFTESGPKQFVLEASPPPALPEGDP